MSIVTDRRKLKAEIKEKRRVVLPTLKRAVKAAQTDRQKRLKACKADCARLLKQAAQRAKTAHKKLKLVIARSKAKAKQACASCKTLDERGLNQIESALEALESERKEIAKLRAQASVLISERGRAGGKKSAERRAEADDEVIRNLGEDKDLITLFKKLRATIKINPRRTRTETFLEYVHDHPEALDELRAKSEGAYGRQAEKLFRERQPEASGCESCSSCKHSSGKLTKCERELAELKSAEKFLEDADIPF